MAYKVTPEDTLHPSMDIGYIIIGYIINSNEYCIFLIGHMTY